jgi:hypothetical protein
LNEAVFCGIDLSDLDRALSREPDFSRFELGWRKRMKSLLYICCILSIIGLCFAHFPAGAQQGGSASSDQWLSHQMNQPPPGAGGKDLSQDRLDDIRQLYEQAKKEAAAKAAQKPADKK